MLPRMSVSHFLPRIFYFVVFSCPEFSVVPKRSDERTVRRERYNSVTYICAPDAAAARVAKVLLLV